MPRTRIPIAGTSKSGVDAPQKEAADPANGNAINNSGGQTVLILGNAGTVNRTMQLQVTATVDGLPVNARAITVGPDQEMLCGPYPIWWYGDTLLLDPEHADLRISAIRPGEGLDNPANTTVFRASGPVVIAETAFPGVVATGSFLDVDTTITTSTVDGAVLVVPV
jgi:hypothetical protein